MLLETASPMTPSIARERAQEIAREDRPLEAYSGMIRLGWAGS